jgi:hypothetical protein
MRPNRSNILWILALMAVSTASCSQAGSSDSQDLVGVARIALTNVPADGTCVGVTASGYRVVSRFFDATAGSNAVLEMSGLPLGQVTFTAEAFPGSCPPSPDAIPTWIDDGPSVVTVAVTPAVQVSLNLVRNGNANVSIGFDDQGDASAGQGGAPATPDGGAGGQGGAGPTGGGAEGGIGGADGGSAATTVGAGDAGPSTISTFMQLTGVTGGATAPGFEGWFEVETFALTATPTSISPSGTVETVTRWSATATLRYQKGVPELYGEIAQPTKKLRAVKLSTIVPAGVPGVAWSASIPAASIASIASGGPGDVPDLLITFGLDTEVTLTLDSDPPSGSSPLTLGSEPVPYVVTSPTTLFEFVIGGPPGPGQFPATAFVPPSEPKPAPELALTMPMGPPVFSLLSQAATLTTWPTGAVDFDQDGSAGPAPLGSYGLSKIEVGSVTFSPTLATLNFDATVSSWSTAGGPTVTAP